MTHEQYRRRLLRSIPRLIREIELQINTVKWWNNHRPDAAPMDCEAEQVLVVKLRIALDCAKRDVPIPEDLANAGLSYMTDVT